MLKILNYIYLPRTHENVSFTLGDDQIIVYVGNYMYYTGMPYPILGGWRDQGIPWKVGESITKCQEKHETFIEGKYIREFILGKIFEVLYLYFNEKSYFFVSYFSSGTASSIL